MEALKTVGQAVPRTDVKEKVTGTAQYVDDLEFGPNLLHAEIVESPLAHALIKKIDTSKAKKLPGVMAVVTGEDFPKKFGVYMKDRYIFARDRVRFVGEQVAAVISRDPRIARKGAGLVKVDYKKLPVITDLMKSVKKDAELIHPDLINYQRVPYFYPIADTNIAHHKKVRKGDIKKGFAQADIVLEDSYQVPRYAHCCMETHIAVARVDEAGRLTVWASSQSPFTLRNNFALTLGHLGFKYSDVRVLTPYIGGGFGGKAGVTMEILAAAFATKLRGYPIRLRWRRDQEFYNTYMRQGLSAKLKMGVKKDGTITAFEMSMYWDAGPYVEYGANVTNAIGLTGTGPYRIDNVKIDSYCVYTNLPAAGPYRGFGYPEALFCVESHMKRLADKLGMTHAEISKKNAIKRGDPVPYGAPMNDNGLIECIDKVAAALKPEKKESSKDPDKVIGKGIAAIWKAPAMPPNASSSAFLKFSRDGSVNIQASGIAMGQGYNTVMAQIASEILTVPVEKIRLESVDTDRSPFEWQACASRITWASGNAVLKAALDARERLLKAVSEGYSYRRDSLYLEDEKVKCLLDPDFELPFKDFIIEGIMQEDGTFRGGPIMGEGMHMPEYTTTKHDPATGQGSFFHAHFTVGAGGVVLEIDKKTGKITVLKAALAIDVGKALNPETVRGQYYGGFMQGLATVLYEDIRFDKDGRFLNPNFADYKIPTALEMPREFIPIIVEVPQHDGPFGARGIGEHVTIPVAPAVANAVEDALGIRIKSMPLTAEKIALAVAAGKKEVD